MGFFDWWFKPGPLRDPTPSALGSLVAQYRVNPTHVDYELARRLYRNQEPRYALGAWAAKPVVNTLAGFMGAPKFRTRTGDKDIQAVLDDDANIEWETPFLTANRDCALEGDVYCRIELVESRFNPGESNFELKLLPPEWVDPIWDPLTGEFSEVVITYPVLQRRRDGNRIKEDPQYSIVEVLKPNTRELAIQGSAPQEARDELAARIEREGTENRWGFIPMVQMRNEGHRSALYGMSELEPIEPFMRAYNDIMCDAVTGAKSFAQPKVEMTLGDVKGFLETNFSEQEIQSKQLNFSNKKIFLNKRDDKGTDKIEFITAQSGIEGAMVLCQFLFACIVDVSQVPEFAFGTAVASSKASTETQMPVLARNIRRKRGDRAEPLKEIGSSYLAMQARVSGIRKPDTYKVGLDWEELTQKDESEIALTIKNMVDGLVTAIKGGLMSQQSAVDYLAEFVPSMLPFSTEDNGPDERQRIIDGRALMDRLENATFDVNAPEPPPHIRLLNTLGAGN